MGLLRGLSSDYEAWVNSIGVGGGEQIRMALLDAISDGKFGAEPGQPNVYHLGKRVHDFNPELADPECFGQPKRVEYKVAFQYLFYLGLCKRHDVQPGPFIDQRHYSTIDDSGDVEVVQAQDC